MKFFLTSLLLTAFILTTSAQTCSRIIKSKTGKVYSANPATIKTTATSKDVTILIKKTKGRAETQVNIYVDGIMKPNPINYDNGTYIPTGWQKRELTNVDGKEIKVKVVNQSVANTFSYELQIKSNSKILTTTGKKIKGNLYGQTKKTMYTKGSCTGKVKIVIKRTPTSTARGTIRVWIKGNTGEWIPKNEYNQTLEKLEMGKEFIVNSSSELKVELKNISIGNRLQFSMNALVSN